MVIDFFTRRRIDRYAPAKLEIIEWDETQPTVLFDGIAPRDLAMRFKAECEKFNRETSR